MTLTFVRRSLLRRPFLNLIKATGLTISLSCLVLLSLFLKHELTFETFIPDSDRIYRFTITSPEFFSGKHFARVYGGSYIPEMAHTLPGIEHYTRLSPVSGGIVQWKEKKVLMRQAFECDSTFFEVFDVSLMMGDPSTVLNGPGSLVIAESYAKRIFGESDPIGQVLTIPEGRYFGESQDYVVNGIMMDFPKNSHFHPGFIVSPLNKTVLDGWSWIYLLLEENTDPRSITSSFPDFLAHFNEQDPEEVDQTAHLQRITDIHLRSAKTREIEPNGNILVVYSFMAAALILLFVALINYFNLNLGMEGFSDNYLFVLRVSGASRAGRLKHFILEGMIVGLVAALISLVIVGLANSFILKRFGLNLWAGNFWFVLGISFFLLLLGVITGIAPHLRMFLSSGGRSKRRGISNGLIVFQYAIGIILIASVVVIQRQTTFALKSGIGAGNENIVCVDYVHSDIVEKFESFKKELLTYPSIESVTAMLQLPGDDVNDMFRFAMGGYEADETLAADDLIGILPCDYSFATLFNLTFLAGSNFSEAFSDNEGSGEYIINESAMKRLGYSNPNEILDKDFQLFFESDVVTIPAGRIVGVVADYHFSSMRREIEPQVLFKRKDLWIDNLVISFSPGMRQQALKDFESVWQELFPEYTFRYEYVDSIYRKVYLSERLQANLLLLFTAFTLFICSMGLMGLSLLSTQHRKKEIGIRVVNGAGIRHIVIMLNWDFLKWIVISNAVALPVAYLAMKRWLEDFVYRIDLSWWIFLMAGVVAFIIAGFTVTIHSWKAAAGNPLKALRYE